MCNDQESNLVMGGRLTKELGEGSQSPTSDFLDSSFPSASGYQLGKLSTVCLLLICGSHLWEDKDQRKQEEKNGSTAQCTVLISKPPTVFPFVGVFCTLPYEAAGLLALHDCKGHFPCMFIEEAIPISLVLMVQFGSQQFICV